MTAICAARLVDELGRPRRCPIRARVTGADGRKWCWQHSPQARMLRALLRWRPAPVQEGNGARLQ